MKFHLIIIFLLTANLVFTQAPDIQWQKTFGGDAIDIANTISQLPNGNFILAGRSTSDVSGHKTEDSFGDYDAWVIFTDSEGNVIWQKTIGGNAYDEFNQILIISDSIFLLCGSSGSEPSGNKTAPCMGSSDYWILKMNIEGEILAQKTFGGSLWDGINSIRMMDDGGLLIVGKSYSGISGDKTETNLGEIYTHDTWVIKTDSMWTIEWQNTIGSNKSDGLFLVSNTTSDEIMMAGYSNSDASFDKSEPNIGDYDYWVVKMDLSGNILWDRTIGGIDADRASDGIRSQDGGFLILGNSASGVSGDKSEENWDPLGWSDDCWLVKIDSLGNIVWQQTIGGDHDESFTDIAIYPFGGYLITGFSLSDISGNKTDDNCFNGEYTDYDLWILRLDSAGHIIWQKTIGGEEVDICYKSVFDYDGRVIIAASSGSPISCDKTTPYVGGGYDYWLLALAACDSSIEICNGLDEDCDGNIDNGFSLTQFYLDGDGDGFGDFLIDTLSCLGIIDGYVIDSTDCDDSNPFIYPGAPELFNGIDDNCNDIIDENFVEIFTLNNEPYLNISPNPNNGTFYISALSAPLRPLRETNQPCVLEIFNSLGQQIYSQELISSNGNINETISLHNLSSGIYFVRINNIQQKLIIE